MNNYGQGMVISVVTVLVVVYGWSWWYLLPLGWALSFTVFPRSRYGDLLEEKLRLEIDEMKKEGGR